jgi:hypothetical protein
MEVILYLHLDQKILPVTWIGPAEKRKEKEKLNAKFHCSHSHQAHTV